MLCYIGYLTLWWIVNLHDKWDISCHVASAIRLLIVCPHKVECKISELRRYKFIVAFLSIHLFNLDATISNSTYYEILSYFLLVLVVILYRATTQESINNLLWW